MAYDVPSGGERMGGKAEEEPMAELPAPLPGPDSESLAAEQPNAPSRVLQV